VAKCFNGTGCPVTGSSVATWVASKVTTFTPTSKELTVTDADGAVTSFAYDGADRKFVTTDPVNRQTEMVYDAAGNVLQEIRGLGSAIQMTYATYTYGADGEKTSVQDADGPTHITQFTYDGFDRLYQNTFPDGSTETIPLTGGYDAQGNVLQRINRAGQTFKMAYDVLNRLSTKKVPGYTPPGGVHVPMNTTTSLYDLGGRLKSSTDTLGNSVAHGYDTAGRSTSTVTTIVGLTPVLTAQYQLDPNSNRTQLQWPDGYQVNYAYDTLNRMTTATDSASTLLATYTYDAMSRRTNLAYGNTASLAYAYTDAGDLTSLTNDFVTNSKNVAYTLGYTPAHQLASELNSKSAYRYAPSASSATYAPVNALNQYANVNGGTASGTDCHGNAQVMSYDCNGNLTGDGTWSFAYDPENHMVGASSTAASASYAYDPLGRRQTKTVGSTVTNFLSDSDDEIAEYDGTSGNVLRRFVPGPAINQPIAYENCLSPPPNCTGTNLATEYYQTDHHGSVIAMSDATGNPSTTESNYTYDTYGNSPGMTTTGQPFRYVGMYYDAETGLYADRARVYSPALGRFLQNDPIGYKDDIDLYTYTGDDPTDKVDPSGKTTITFGVDLALVVGGGAMMETGVALSFPTPWDPGAKTDLGVYQMHSTDMKGLYGSIGPSFGGSLSGGVTDMRGTAKTTVAAFILGGSSSEPTDGGPKSASTDAGIGKGLEAPKLKLEGAKLKLSDTEGVAMGYAKGTTTTHVGSVNEIMQKADGEVRKLLDTNGSDPMRWDATKKH
jgi:RHS repeat-associated protein